MSSPSTFSFGLLTPSGSNRLCPPSSPVQIAYCLQPSAAAAAETGRLSGCYRGPDGDAVPTWHPEQLQRYRHLQRRHPHVHRCVCGQVSAKHQGFSRGNHASVSSLTHTGIHGRVSRTVRDPRTLSTSPLSSAVVRRAPWRHRSHDDPWFRLSLDRDAGHHSLVCSGWRSLSRHLHPLPTAPACQLSTSAPHP